MDRAPPFVSLGQVSNSPASVRCGLGTGGSGQVHTCQCPPREYTAARARLPRLPPPEECSRDKPTSSLTPTTATNSAVPADIWGLKHWHTAAWLQGLDLSTQAGHGAGHHRFGISRASAGWTYALGLQQPVLLKAHLLPSVLRGLAHILSYNPSKIRKYILVQAHCSFHRMLRPLCFKFRLQFCKRECGGTKTVRSLKRCRKSI